MTPPPAKRRVRRTTDSRGRAYTYPGESTRDRGPMGTDPHCGGAVVATRDRYTYKRGRTASCRRCGLVASVEWWTVALRGQEATVTETGL